MDEQVREYRPRKPTWRQFFLSLDGWMVACLIGATAVGVGNGAFLRSTLTDSGDLVETIVDRWFILALPLGVLFVLAARWLWRVFRRAESYQVGPAGLALITRLGERFCPIAMIADIRVVRWRDVHGRRIERPDVAWWESPAGPSGVEMILIVRQKGPPWLLAPDAPRQFGADLSQRVSDYARLTGVDPTIRRYQSLARPWGLIRGNSAKAIVLGVLAVAGAFSGIILLLLLSVGGLASLWLDKHVSHRWACPSVVRFLPDRLRIYWRVRRKRREILGCRIRCVRRVQEEDLGTIRAESRVFTAAGCFGSVRSEMLGPLVAYVTRGDGLVLIERTDDVPLLLSPEHPDEFVEAVEALRQGRLRRLRKGSELQEQPEARP